MGLAASALPAALLVGWLWHRTSLAFDIVPVGVAGFALLACWLLRFPVRWTKTRHAFTGAIIGATVAMFLPVVRFVSDAGSYGQSLPAYFALQSDSGVTLSLRRYGFYRHNNLNGDFPLGGWEARGGAYWGVIFAESALAAILGGGLLAMACGEPFCQGCDRWITKTFVPPWHPKRTEEIAGLVERQDWEALMEVPRLTNRGAKNRLTLEVMQCDGCGEASLRFISSQQDVPFPTVDLAVSADSARTLREQVRESLKS